ncbi:polyhydroxyalkanoate synthesis regulator DNA-binding domain-containing protein, partial [Streptomyces sp. NPDC005900]|uniref:polyhydroxyalkanoate synthesis regulator DNA-binding domain-containing protein n=1 Tax=Streptomyces sp. NPDC005900 TaxID=3154569 RepID=UPI0033F580D7
MTVLGDPDGAAPAGPHRHRPRPGPGLPSDRLLTRLHGGRLYDVRLHEPVSLEELVQGLRAGRQFTAHDHRTGDDCTYQVLAEVVTWVLGTSVP